MRDLLSQSLYQLHTPKNSEVTRVRGRHIAENERGSQWSSSIDPSTLRTCAKPISIERLNRILHWLEDNCQHNNTRKQDFATGLIAGLALCHPNEALNLWQQANGERPWMEAPKAWIETQGSHLAKGLKAAVTCLHNEFQNNPPRQQDTIKGLVAGLLLCHTMDTVDAHLEEATRDLLSVRETARLVLGSL